MGLVPLAREWSQQPAISGVYAGWQGLHSALRQCLPLAGAVLTGSVYMNLDVVMMANQAKMEEVGW